MNKPQCGSKVYSVITGGIKNAKSFHSVHHQLCNVRMDKASFLHQLIVGEYNRGWQDLSFHEVCHRLCPL